MDPDDKAAFLFELFPDEPIEYIYNILLDHNCDLDSTIKSVLDKDSDQEGTAPVSVFDRLTLTFPEVEIEAIEAFLLTQDESNNLDSIIKEFMKQINAPLSPTCKSPRDRNLKMKLSDFNAILKTSDEEILQRRLNFYSRNELFEFTFLEDDGDWKEMERVYKSSGLEVREMAIDLQAERAEHLKRATLCFKAGNLTGKSSASHYSDEGQSLVPKISRLNRIAAEKILKERNENLKISKLVDLHYLTVAEAQSAAAAFIRHHEILRTPSIQIITGRGIHSLGGICKLSTAIWNFLRAQNRKYSFDEQGCQMTLSLKQKFLNLFELLKADKLTKDNFNDCVELETVIRSASIFSSNEDASDLQSSYIKYLIGDFLFASILECFQMDRLQYLKLAHNYYLNYLNNCIRYELIPNEGVEYAEISRYFMEDKDADDVKEERFEKWLKNVPRDLKIDRMKRILRLKGTEELKSSKDTTLESEELEDEEIDNDFWINWINFCVLMTLDRLGLLLREVELLEMGQDGVEVSQKPAPASKDSTNDKLTKIEKPFKLVKDRDRKQIAADAFKYGHNLPTMTIDEYLELEKKRGNIITGGGAASGVKKEIDEDDQAALEIELMKAREFDEFKDMYSRGSGNTYNRS